MKRFLYTILFILGIIGISQLNSCSYGYEYYNNSQYSRYNNSTYYTTPSGSTVVGAKNMGTTQNTQSNEILKKYEAQNNPLIQKINEALKEKEKEGFFEQITVQNVKDTVQYLIGTALSSFPIPEDGNSLAEKIENSWQYLSYGNNFAKYNTAISLAESMTIIVGDDRKTIKRILIPGPLDNDYDDYIIELEFTFDSEAKPGSLTHIWISYMTDDAFFLYSANGNLEGYYYKGKAYLSNSPLLNNKTIQTLKRLFKDAYYLD